MTPVAREEMDEMMNLSFHTGDDVDSRPIQREPTIYDWTVTELKLLCSRIKDASLRLNKAVGAPYSRTENRLDWESIAFNGHDAEECHVKWQQVCNNVRTYRTMAEVVEDAEQWLQKGPRKAKEAKVRGKSHPDKPTRPPTVFFKFLMEQLPKIKVKHPELNHRQVVSKIGEMYKTITPKKINQLKAEYFKDQEAYRARLEEFYDSHPDLAPLKGPVAVTPKGTSGMAYFIAEKLKEPKHANASREDLRSKWSKLKDEKKVQYIEMALDAHRRTAGATHFIAKPMKDVLSKEERTVYDRFLGKPEKPPSSGFALYRNITCASNYPNLSVAERTKRIQADWNCMSRPEQNKFNNEVKIFRQQYERKMTEYLERLAQREQKLAENDKLVRSNSIWSESAKITNGASAPKKAKMEKASVESPKKAAAPKSSPKKISKFTALTWYQESCLPTWREENQGITDKELRSAIAEHFESLSEKKKRKLTRQAHEENERRGLL